VSTFAFTHEVLDKHIALRTRRELHDIEYPQHEGVKEFITTKVNEYIKQQGKVQSLMDLEIDYILKHIGGHLKDLDAVIASVMRGYSAVEAVDRLLSDSVQYVYWEIEKILNTINVTGTDKDEAVQKFLRFWKMMMTLSAKEEGVNRRKLVLEIFTSQHAKELEYYEQAGFVAYHNEKVGPVPRLLLAGSSSGRKIAELESSQSSLESVRVTAGSPKVRLAFQLVLGDLGAVKSTKELYIELEKKKLNNRLKETLEKRKQLVGEKETWIKLAQTFISQDATWKESFGYVAYENEKREINANILTIARELKEIEKEILEIRNTMETLPASQKTLELGTRNAQLPTINTSSNNTSSNNANVSANNTSPNNVNNANNASVNNTNISANSTSTNVSNATMNASINNTLNINNVKANNATAKAL